MESIMFIRKGKQFLKLPIKPGEELVNQYIDPLTFLISQDYVSPAINRIASDTLKLLEASNFRPVASFSMGIFGMEIYSFRDLGLLLSILFT